MQIFSWFFYDKVTGKFSYPRQVPDCCMLEEGKFIKEIRPG
jgi:hypothetical protein